MKRKELYQFIRETGYVSCGVPKIAMTERILASIIRPESDDGDTLVAHRLDTLAKEATRLANALRKHAGKRIANVCDCYCGCNLPRPCAECADGHHHSGNNLRDAE